MVSFATVCSLIYIFWIIKRNLINQIVYQTILETMNKNEYILKISVL